MASSMQIVIDCADPAGLSAFWATALSYENDPPPPGYQSWPDCLKDKEIPEERWNDAGAISDPTGVGPRVFFQRVSEPKSVKNRLHLDLAPTRDRDPAIRAEAVRAEVARLVEAGAVEVDERSEFGSSWTVMRDPEGNEFCVHGPGPRYRRYQDPVRRCGCTTPPEVTWWRRRRAKPPASTCAG